MISTGASKIHPTAVNLKSPARGKSTPRLKTPSKTATATNGGEKPELKESDLANINVGGVIFTTTYTNLKSIPDTRLSAISVSSKEYVATKDYYFFDRNSDIFSSVLDFYRTGELHLPKQICGASIRNELEFWQIPSTSIADCCVSSLFKFEDEIELSNKLRKQLEAPTLEYTETQLRNSKWNRFKSRIWTIVDKPDDSVAAKVYSTVYMLFVLLTCLIFILSSDKHFRTPVNDVVYVNGTKRMPVYDFLMMTYNNRNIALLGSTRDILAIEILHYICTLFFSLELLLRVVVCPSRKEMFKNWLNIVDVIIVISLLVSFAMTVSDSNLYITNRSMMMTYLVARGFIVLRLLRLFRFARHFTGLKVVYLALRASLKELGLLCLTFFITTSLFGALIYYMEFYVSSDIDNVLVGIWWATVTLTTVGYGDIVPTAPGGFVLGGICAMCGLLLLSMPIAIIATNFNNYYNQNKVREKLIQRRKNVLSAMKVLFSSRQTAPLVVETIDNSQSVANGNVGDAALRHKAALRRFRQIAVKAAKM